MSRGFVKLRVKGLGVWGPVVQIGPEIRTSQSDVNSHSFTPKQADSLTPGGGARLG